MLLAQVVTRYGFFGIHGFLGVVIGLLILGVVIWGIWAIFDLVAARFPGNLLVQILRIVLIVVCVVWFLQAMFNVFG
jgi:hypothetical protein